MRKDKSSVAGEDQQEGQGLLNTHPDTENMVRSAKQAEPVVNTHWIMGVRGCLW